MKRILFIVFFCIPLLTVAQDFRKLKSKAEAGDVAAMVSLHHYYVSGIQTSVDTAKAYSLLQRAASLGYADAMAWLSKYELIYRHDTAAALQMAAEASRRGSLLGSVRQAVHLQKGVGGRRNFALAIQLLEQAAANGCSEAHAHLAAMYLDGGDSCEYSPSRALEHIDKTDHTVGSERSALLARYWQLMGDSEKARRWTKQGMKDGSFNAQLYNVLQHFYGIGTPEDEHAAMQALAELYGRYGNRAQLLSLEMQMRWQSADPLLHDTAQCRQLLLRIGDTPGANNYSRLAESYLYGQFTPQDSAMALRYWRRGVSLGDATCMNQLAAWHLSNGRADSCRYWVDRALALASRQAVDFCSQAYSFGWFDDTPDYARALPFAIEAGRRGDLEQQVHAGKLCLWLGDTVRARQLFQRAIDLGHFDACANMAQLERDLGNPRWTTWLKQGIKHHNTVCLNAMGDYYSQQQNYRQAARHYAEADDPEGRYELGRLYLFGSIGHGDADRQKGLSLIRSSEHDNYADAILLTAALFEEGEVVAQNFDSVVYMLRRLVDMNDTRGMMHLARYYEQGTAVPQDSAAALQLYSLACSHGHSLACDLVADRYRYGQAGLSPDPATAFLFYNQAAAGDNAHGLFDVADCYLQGVGTHIDTAKAIVYLFDALHAGSPRAASLLADFYLEGRAGLPRNADTAMLLYRQASDQDDPRGDYMMGRYLFESGYYENAIGFLQSAASNGSLDAYILLAQALLTGLGIEADPVAAVDMLRQAIPSDASGQALLLLGIAQLNGTGTTPDETAAIGHISQAVDLGNTAAMTTLGSLYAVGQGVGRDTVRSVQLFEQAAARGDENAMLQLAGSYLQGLVAPHNPQRAAELYRQAADRGNTDAMCRLGLCYEEGIGVVANSRRAYTLYSDAADHGSAWGMRLVALCHAHGTYVEPDDTLAAQWMQRSAEAGDPTAAYIVGQLYAEGKVVKKNRKQARHWLTIAAQAGVEGAAEALQAL